MTWHFKTKAETKELLRGYCRGLWVWRLQPCLSLSPDSRSFLKAGDLRRKRRTGGGLGFRQGDRRAHTGRHCLNEGGAGKMAQPGRSLSNLWDLHE